jgi:hypothetical protein
MYILRNSISNEGAEFHPHKNLIKPHYEQKGNVCLEK